jgi:hypothetical protein
MNQKHSRVVGLETPDNRGVSVDEHGVSANWHWGYGLCAVPHRGICVSSVNNLELVAMHVPRVAAGVEIVDHDLNTIRYLVSC